MDNNKKPKDLHHSVFSLVFLTGYLLLLLVASVYRLQAIFPGVPRGLKERVGGELGSAEFPTRFRPPQGKIITLTVNFIDDRWQPPRARSTPSRPLSECRSHLTISMRGGDAARVGGIVSKGRPVSKFIVE